MTEPASLLHALGWHDVTGPQLHDAVVAFQTGYALGPALRIDGIVGPLTQAALEHSQAAGGRASEHFKWSEFGCHCGQILQGCRGILIRRSVVLNAEVLRESHYPAGLRVVSGYRCPRHNAAVGGASRSQHLDGLAIDVEPRVRPDDLRGSGWTGIGFSPSSHLVVHVDRRPGLPVTFPDGR